MLKDDIIPKFSSLDVNCDEIYDILEYAEINNFFQLKKCLQNRIRTEILNITQVAFFMRIFNTNLFVDDIHRIDTCYFDNFLRYIFWCSSRLFQIKMECLCLLLQRYMKIVFKTVSCMDLRKMTIYFPNDSVIYLCKVLPSDYIIQLIQRV